MIRLPSIIAACVAAFGLASSPGWAADAARTPARPLDTGAAIAHFVQDRNGVSVIELSGDYDSNLADGTPNTEPRAVVAREFYRNHPDSYDMLVVFTQFPIQTGDRFAFYESARNQVLGIGVSAFDFTADYGSQGKLLGMIDMADLQRHSPTNLNANFNETLTAFSHEFLHQFAAHIKYRKPDGTLGTDLLGRDGAHWSYLLDTDASVLYGSKWQDNGDGTFTAAEVEQRYSPLDLYLMGFGKKQDVPPFFIIDAPGVDPTQLPLAGATVSGTARTVTIDDVIAAEGPRIPDSTQAQKEYRIAFIYAVRPGSAVGDSEVASLNDIRRAIGSRFSAMTGGVANINVFPEGLTGAATGAPPACRRRKARPSRRSTSSSRRAGSSRSRTPMVPGPIPRPPPSATAR